MVLTYYVLLAVHDVNSGLQVGKRIDVSRHTLHEHAVHVIYRGSFHDVISGYTLHGTGDVTALGTEIPSSEFLECHRTLRCERLDARGLGIEYLA